MSIAANTTKVDGFPIERILRAGFLLLAAIIFVSNLHAFFGWNERNGVHDSICYLRQAHLFQRFGLSGIDTNILRDDDGFFKEAQRSIGLPVDADPALAVCHPISRADKRVLQYPPGTGFLMSAFPAGTQAAWLYTFCMLIVAGAGAFVLSLAKTRVSIVVTGIFGLTALYFMVNPTKASYSMAPTVAVCILAAILTPTLFVAKELSTKLITATILGLLLGLSVSFRTANLLLVVGYVLVLGLDYLRKRDRRTFAIGLLFALAYGLGLGPSLLANYVNAGSIFSTTYGPNDVVPMDLTLSIVGEYFKDMQAYLAILAIAGTAWMLGSARCRAPVAIVGVNVAVNLGFFLTHPVFTQYYVMPVITLSLWTLLAHWLIEHSTYKRPLGM